MTTNSVNPVSAPKSIFNSGEVPYNATGTTDWGYPQYATPWNTNTPPGPVEGFQANNSALSPSTSLVTITIGGNDARFGDVMLGCLATATKPGSGDCSRATWQLTRSKKNGDAVDPTALISFEPLVISWLLPHLVQTYLAINDVAQSADIVVVGYPYIFPQNATTSCNSGSFAGAVASLSANAQNMLNGFASDLDNVINQAVKQVQADGVDIQFVNPQAAFTGHDVCGSSSWFLPLSLVVNKPGNYHPNPAGQQALADLANQCLAGTLPACTS